MRGGLSLIPENILIEPDADNSDEGKTQKRNKRFWRLVKTFFIYKQLSISVYEELAFFLSEEQSCPQQLSGAIFTTRKREHSALFLYQEPGMNILMCPQLFLSANDSKHDEELREDAYLQLLFQGSQYSDYLNIYGRATISREQAIIDELWNPMFKTWFTEGKEDPRISVIKVIPVEGYYWDNKNNVAVGFIKRMVGAALGKTLDDSIEGKVNP